jgi:hypothetical protein
MLRPPVFAIVVGVALPSWSIKPKRIGCGLDADNLQKCGWMRMDAHRMRMDADRMRKKSLGT